MSANYAPHSCVTVNTETCLWHSAYDYILQGCNSFSLLISHAIISLCSISRDILSIVVQLYFLTPFETGCSVLEWEYTSSVTDYVSGHVRLIASIILFFPLQHLSEYVFMEKCSDRGSVMITHWPKDSRLLRLTARLWKARGRYVCTHCYIIIIIPSTGKSSHWAMAEFCSSCSVVDTVRHHAKASSHFCLITGWVLPSASSNCTGMSTMIHLEV